MNASYSSRLRGLLGLLVAVVVLWVGRKSLAFDFIHLLDDDKNIIFNPHIGIPDGDRLRWMFTDFSYVPRYMPLGWLGFCVAYLWSGLDPWAYHAMNLGFHALNAVLV